MTVVIRYTELIVSHVIFQNKLQYCGNVPSAHVWNSWAKHQEMGTYTEKPSEHKLRLCQFIGSSKEGVGSYMEMGTYSGLYSTTNCKIRESTVQYAVIYCLTNSVN